MNQFAKEQLAAILRDAAKGSFPPADGGVTVLPQPSPRDAGVWGFTAHAVVFADVDQDWVTSHLPAGDLGAPLGPPFLQALSEATDRRPGSIDMLCVAEPLPGPPPIDLAAELERDPSAGSPGRSATATTSTPGEARTAAASCCSDAASRAGARRPSRSTRTGAAAASAARSPSRPAPGGPGRAALGAGLPRPTPRACGRSWRPGSGRSARRSCWPGARQHAPSEPRRPPATAASAAANAERSRASASGQSTPVRQPDPPPAPEPRAMRR